MSEVMMSPQWECSVCKKTITFEMPPYSPQPIPHRIRHCAGGNHVDVPGKVTKLLEVKENKWVLPVYGDLLDGDDDCTKIVDLKKQLASAKTEEERERLQVAIKDHKKWNPNPHTHPE